MDESAARECLLGKLCCAVCLDRLQEVNKKREKKMTVLATVDIDLPDRPTKTREKNFLPPT
jgi:hypothetical protein